MSVAKAALEKYMSDDDVEDSDDADESYGKKKDEESPTREVLREAWTAVKGDDFDGFADAVEALVEIKLAER